MFEVKKIENQWLIRPTGGQFRQLKIPAGALHVEVSDNFLLVDDTVYEIKASGNIAYVEKLRSIPLAEESNKKVAFNSKGGATSEETRASVEKLQDISIAEKIDGSAYWSKSNITVAECEKGADINLSLEIEDGQTEYDSLEVGQTEDTSVIEIIKGDAEGQARYKVDDSKKTHRPSSAKKKHVTDHNDKRASNNFLPSSKYPCAVYAKSSQGFKIGEFILYLGRHQELHIYTGDILSLPNVDIIVCENDKNGKSLGGLAIALAGKCSDPYKKDVEMKFKTLRNPGDIVFVSSWGLTNVKWIAHVVPFMKKDCKTREETTQKVASMYEKIFTGLKDNGCRSLALPLIGTGKGNVKPDFTCKCLLEGLETFCVFNKNFEFTIHLVQFEPENTRIAIECAEQKIQDVNSRPAN